MKHHYASYVRRVERNLDLPWRQRKELLRGLQSELRERFVEPPSEETLLVEVGPPEEVAQALLLGVDGEKEMRHRKVKLLRIRCVAAVLGILLAVSVGLICYYGITQVGRAEITITPDPVPTQYAVNGKSK